MNEKRLFSAGFLFLMLLRLLLAGSVLYIVYFIFSNSREVAEVSVVYSDRFAEWLNSYLIQRGIAAVDSVGVRKLAHFCEFALLGFWCTLCLRVYTRHCIRHISWPLMILMLAAISDETIQSSVAGRTSQLSDVWLDIQGGSCGVLCGLAIILVVTGIVWVIRFLWKRRRK